jgi:uncharacterized cupin superfamily protein
VFDGLDGSQKGILDLSPDRFLCCSRPHDYDEYMVVVQGCYTMIIGGERIPIRAGMEYMIPKGTPHAGEVVAGTRTIHAFGGHRADRTEFFPPFQ